MPLLPDVQWLEYSCFILYPVSCCCFKWDSQSDHYYSTLCGATIIEMKPQEKLNEIKAHYFHTQIKLKHVSLKGICFKPLSVFSIPFHLVSKALPTFPIMLSKVEENNYIPNKTQEGSIDPSPFHCASKLYFYWKIFCYYLTKKNQ